MKTRHFGDMHFIFPDDGVMLTAAAGERTENGIRITARVDTKSGKKMSLNGMPMKDEGYGVYSCPIELCAYKTALTAKDEESGEECAIDVYYLKNGYKKYRFSLDDNIWFLQNLTENKDKFVSMFEDPYLALLKQIHEEYGSVFHVNVYYETPRHGGFNLSEMTDKYKDEWKKNSDWLRLSFHANADAPARPYAHTDYGQAYFECERVHKEILRFAGKEAMAGTVTTVHCGDCTKESARAFRDLGYRAFVSSYKKTESGVDIRMYLDSEKCEILQKYGFYYDKEEDIVHFRYNGGIQHITPEEIGARLDRQEKEVPNYLFKDICLHEQYFYEEFFLHQNNYLEKLRVSAQWCRSHGYTPTFMDTLFEFNTH